MKCKKCQDRGFTEENYGLIRVFCDCEKGKALRAEVTGEVEILPAVSASGGIPEGMEVPAGETSTGETFVEVAAEANVFANSVMPKLEGEEVLPGIKYKPMTTGEIDDGISRTEPDNKPTRSETAGKHKQPAKPKARKKTARRPG